ncbi:hypothetical protein MPNT_230046 [Candidatus Methylacidithermus pantelleriae]|uniref:Uncharacterized protein n=1 Tax=Candidatus Methylacidithermus pantelleriae TaxID=2744239 RepID=A0A8J2BM01_9BACT|nr:hypothetical protein MPNT_230046 [Candidatus Methylacidithermus pantelleriae]
MPYNFLALTRGKLGAQDRHGLRGERSPASDEGGAKGDAAAQG